MVKLRLFANLREAAGTGSAEFAGASVGSVVAAAAAEYGNDFRTGLTAAKVWVNGNPADDSTPVSDGDEIALIPPVSGGAAPVRARQDTAGATLVLALVAALVVANFVSIELFSLAAVGVALVWLWDVRDTLRLRGIRLEIIPVMAATAAAVNGAYGWNAEGFASGLGVGLVFQLVWVVLDRRSRSVEAIARATSLGLVAGLSAGGAVLVRLRAEEEVTLFLVLAGVAALAGWALQRLAPGAGGVDPNVVGLAAALIAGIAAALVTDVLDMPVMILAALGLGVGFIAGRAFGALCRIDEIVHTRRPPGLLTSLDGPLLSAAMFWAVVSIFG